jgi:hypothetical protein
MIRNQHNFIYYIPDGRRGAPGKWTTLALAMKRNQCLEMPDLLSARSLARAVKIRFGSSSMRKQPNGKYLVGVPE